MDSRLRVLLVYEFAVAVVAWYSSVSFFWR